MKNSFLVLDIGTTTLCATLCTSNGTVLGNFTCNNPQIVFGSDVISRISACANGKTQKMQELLYKDIIAIKELFENSKPDCCIKSLYVCANPTMLHIFCGYSAQTLGTSPFTPVFTDFLTIDKSNTPLPFDKIYVLPSASAFIGSDILCGVVLSNLTNMQKPALLIDFGTNTEMVLCHNNNIFACSASAGGAFEGANISCGVSAISGAIYKVEKIENSPEQLYFCTIDNKQPIGICGSAIFDIISYLLQSKIIDNTGKFVNSNRFNLCGYHKGQNGLFLDVGLINSQLTVTQDDIRAFQCAKSAVRTGVELLSLHSGILLEDIEKVYLSGSFGSNLNPNSVLHCDILPQNLCCEITQIGNSSLMGAIDVATNKNKLSKLIELSKVCKTINIAQDSRFQQLFIKNINFQA